MKSTHFVWSLAVLGLSVASPAAGQLRPLEPLDWAAIDAPTGFRGAVGMAVFGSQRASLAGTEGRLLEFGAYHGSWGLGQVVIQISGTALRVFHDESVFAAPVSQARAPTGKRRIDAGDQRVSTIIRLTEGVEGFDLALRFGVRLPTTDNTTGLERDQTDFFSTVGSRYRRDALLITSELGFGVLGTRSAIREQIDPILYALSVGWDAGLVRPEFTLVGQYDTRPTPNLRGNEDLAEVAISGTVGRDHWLKMMLIRGLGDFSPSIGLSLEFGIRR